MKNLFTRRIGFCWVTLLIFVIPVMMGCDDQNFAVNDGLIAGKNFAMNTIHPGIDKNCPGETPPIILPSG